MLTLAFFFLLTPAPSLAGKESKYQSFFNRTNLALGAVVNGSQHEEPYLPSHATDGDRTTCYKSILSQEIKWLAVTLPEEHWIESVVLDIVLYPSSQISILLMKKVNDWFSAGATNAWSSENSIHAGVHGRYHAFNADDLYCVEAVQFVAVVMRNVRQMEVYDVIIRTADFCSVGRYGLECDQACNCKGACHTTTGKCLTACKFGYAGPNCDVSLVVILFYLVVTVAISIAGVARKGYIEANSIVDLTSLKRNLPTSTADSNLPNSPTTAATNPLDSPTTTKPPNPATTTSPPSPDPPNHETVLKE